MAPSDDQLKGLNSQQSKGGAKGPDPQMPAPTETLKKEGQGGQEGQGRRAEKGRQGTQRRWEEQQAPGHTKRRQRTKQHQNDLALTKEQLQRLGDRLELARGAKVAAQERRSSALGQAFRLATELVVGVGVGIFIGWWLDRLFDTQPVFILIFFVLGIAAGILNVVRTAKTMQAENPPTGHSVRDEDDE